MFTIAQIDALHARLASARTIAEYVRALKALGLERYDSYLADGHSEYFGQRVFQELRSIVPNSPSVVSNRYCLLLIKSRECSISSENFLGYWSQFGTEIRGH